MESGKLSEAQGQVDSPCSKGYGCAYVASRPSCALGKCPKDNR